MAQPLSEDPLYGVGEPEFDPDNIEFRKFGTARRGYSPNEVRPYLAAIADALRDAQRREGETRSRLGKAIRRADNAEAELEADHANLAEVEARAQQVAVPHDDISDAEITERLGEQVAQVLHSAREAAETRVSQAQLRAREMFEAAEAEVTDIRWRAELVYGEKTAEAEAAAEKIIAAARQEAGAIGEEAAAIIAESRIVANELLVAAQVEGEGLIQQAQEARFQVLADMDKKRRTMRSQAELLKAGRDRLMQSHGIVQDTLNEIANELRASVSEAKIKGDSAARAVDGEPPAGPEALHSEIADAALIGTISIPEVERYEDSPAAHKAEAFVRTGQLADLVGEFTEAAIGPVTGTGTDTAAAEVEVEVASEEERVEEAEVEFVAEVVEETTVEFVAPVEPIEVAEPDDAEVELAGAAEELGISIVEPELVEPELVEPELVEPELVVEQVTAAEPEPEPEAVVADVEREEARIIRVVDPRDSIRVLESTENLESASPTAEMPIAVDELAAVDIGPIATLADATGFEVAPARVTTPELADPPVAAETTTSMDSLFDRLRSKRGSDGGATEVAPIVDSIAADTSSEPEPEAQLEAHDAADESLSATTTGSPTTRTDDAAIIAQRDEAIIELQGTVERRLKRVLADEQNHVLEAIGDRKRKTSVLEAMPSARTHADMYVAAIVPQIEACYRAGAAFVDPLAVVTIANNGPFVENVLSVIAPIRAMIAELADAPEDEASTATVRTFYRGFKKQDLAVAASAIAVQAFSLGSTAALTDGTPVRWVFFDHAEGCPDGHDNSLTPQQLLGEKFPCGAYHPPTTPRCRCVLVPADR